MSFRTTNPVQSPRIRIRFDRIAASVAVGAVLGGLGMYTFVIASEKAPVTPQESTEVSVVQEEVSSRENGAQGCAEQLSAWSEDAAQLIDDVTYQYDQGVIYNASVVRGENVNPMIDRLAYIRENFC